MIRKIWLYPPLAFARVGGSSVPADNFGWGPDDLRPAGTGRVQLMGSRTLSVGEDGAIVDSSGDERDSLQLKDDGGFRPVCPFFELHGEWDGDGGPVTGPITLEQLKAVGCTLDDAEWKVQVANRKAYRFTRAEEDIVEAECSSTAGTFDQNPLRGWSRRGAGARLASEKQAIPMGHVQVIRPTERWPELRVRFTPPAGLVYAPRGLADRLRKEVPGATEALKAIAVSPKGRPLAALLGELETLNHRWDDFSLPEEQCILNPSSEWSTWAWPSKTAPLSLERVLGVLAQGDDDVLKKFEALGSPGDRSPLIRFLIKDDEDAGNLPPGIFSFFVHPGRLLSSLGMVDDISDGFVSVRIRKLDLGACARIVVTPPSIAPDRRAPISLADGLIDRVARAQVRDPAWVRGDNAARTDAEVHDLLARAHESAGLQNADAVANFFRTENGHLAQLLDSDPEAARKRLWDSTKLNMSADLPVTAMAWQHHRRMAVPQVFENFVRNHPDWVAQRARPPMAADGAIESGKDRYYDERMPALMRGFDREPLRLTRRQYELLKYWTERLGESP